MSAGSILSAFGVFSLCLVIYSATMLPSVGWDDTPELAVAIECLGIPHSPGFPLFVLAGRTLRVLGFTPGAKAGSLVAAISVAGAAGLMSWFVTQRFGVWLGFAAGIAVGLSPAAWREACRTEVYGLHLFLATFLILMSAGQCTIRRAVFSGYVLIMGVVTHPSAWGFTPLLFRSFGSRQRALAVLTGMALAATVLIFLPIRSSHAPFLDWGNSSTPAGFVWLVTLQEFAGDFSSGLLIPGGSIERAIQTVAHFLVSAFPPFALGLAVVGLPILIRRWAALPASMLGLIVLTCAGGGGPDTAGYLLPLIPAATLCAVMASSFLRMPRALTTVVWFAALILLVGPVLRTLDRSGDSSAASYQQALAANCENRLLFTDNTSDWFLLLDHAFRFHSLPNVVYTPYLGLPWYRATLDAALVRYLPPRSDPPEELIEGAVGNLGIEPVYSFSSLPQGALGRLNPEGWIFRTEPFNATRDEEALEKWNHSCSFGSPGSYHRAVRLAQGGQLLLAQGLHRVAVERLGMALLCDPTNPGIWLALADAKVRLDCHQHALLSAKTALSLAPRDQAIAQKGAGIIASLAAGRLGVQAAAVLCSLSSANTPDTELAAHALRASLLAKRPSKGLACLAAYTGPMTPEVVNLEGTALFMEGRLTDAERRFRRALALASTKPALQARIAGNLVLCLRQQGKLEEAESVSRKWRPLRGNPDGALPTDPPRQR